MGRGARAREAVASKAAEFDSRLAINVGWSCYHAMAYDLAFDLLLRDFSSQFKRFTYLPALENAAVKSDRLEALRQVYEAYAPREPSLYGRLKRMGITPQ